MANNADELRILLWGKTGIGKSASGNIILGKKEFPESDLSSESRTKKSKKANEKRRGKDLVVVDTPGLMHTRKSKREVMEDLVSCFLMLPSGPHVFLYVLKPNSFSKEDREILKKFKSIFKGALSHTIFLFTHGDLYNAEEFIRTSADVRFIQEAKIPYHVFNNQDYAQADGLLDKITELVEKNNGKHYSDELFNKAEGAVEEMMKAAPTANPPEDPVLANINQGLDHLEQIAPGLSWLRGFLERAEKVAIKFIE